MITRRKVAVVLGAGAFALLASFAQKQGKVWRIGFLTMRSRPASIEESSLAGFRKGMLDLGYVEVKNLLIEWRFADGNVERLQELANGLVQNNIDVIVAAGPQATSAAQKATGKIPIVMVISHDPVKSGMVASMRHPGGNITGLSNFSNELAPKQLEMLTATVPGHERVAVLINPSNQGHSELLRILEASAPKLGTRLLPVPAQTIEQIDAAFRLMRQEKADALLVALDGFFITQVRQITALAQKYRMPSIAAISEHVDEGGLLSYGRDTYDQYGSMATFVDKILRGAKPGDLPVEQPTRFVLVINVKTAKSLGIKVPHTILLLATRVIE